MNSATIKEYIPLVKRILVINLTLITYFIMPNFISFLFTAILLILIINPQELIQQITNK